MKKIAQIARANEHDALAIFRTAIKYGLGAKIFYQASSSGSSYIISVYEHPEQWNEFDWESFDNDPRSIEGQHPFDETGFWMEALKKHLKASKK